MMFRKKIIYLIMFTLICSIFLNSTEAISKTKKQDVLILVDEDKKLSELEINPINIIRDSLSMHNLSIEVLNFKDYTKDTIDKYDFVIPIVLEKIEYSKDLFDDLDEYKHPIFWIGNDLNKYIEKNLKYSYTETNILSSIKEVDYKQSEKFIINKSGKFNVCDFNREKIKVYSTIKSGEKKKIYIMNEKNLWYASLIPNERSLIFILCDVINDFLGVDEVEKSNGFIDIGEINPYIDQKKLREIADYLYSENISFVASISPIYFNDRNKVEATISQTEGFVETINYMEEKGATIALDGFNISGYEKKEDSNLYIDEFIGSELRECVENNIYPIAIKLYNNNLNFKEDEKLDEYFSTFIYGTKDEISYNNKITYPYITREDKNLNINLWENLGNITLEDKMWFQKLKDNYRLVSINRQFVAGVAFNSSEDIDSLKKTIEFLETKDIKFLNLKEYDNWVKYEGINIASDKGEISIDCKLDKNNSSKSNDSYISQINRFLIVILIIFCLIFISIFIYYKKINKNKLFRR